LIAQSGGLSGSDAPRRGRGKAKERARKGQGKSKEHRPTQIVIFEVRGAHCRDFTRKATTMDAGNRNRSLQTDAARLERDAKDRDDKRRAQDAERHDRLDDALERGLEDTFPASDPVSITQPPHNLWDRRETRRH